MKSYGNSAAVDLFLVTATAQLTPAQSGRKFEHGLSRHEEIYDMLNGKRYISLPIHQGKITTCIFGTFLHMRNDFPSLPNPIMALKDLHS